MQIDLDELQRRRAVIASDSEAIQKRGGSGSDLFDSGCWLAASAGASSQ